MASSVSKRLTGLVAAPFTPLTTEGKINLCVIAPYVDYLVNKQGVHSVFVNGTTGECMSLSTDERKKLTEEWCLKGKGKLKQIIVHVGCFNLKDSQELARHADGLGVDGIAVIAPSFFKSAGGIQQYLQSVAAAAPSLPFYYYHVPVITGLTLRAWEVLDGIEKSIPSFAGVKFSSPDLMDFGLCVSKYPSNWSYLYGVDEQLLAALAMGTDGAVGSTYNYMGGVSNKLLDAFNKNDLVQARTIQFQVQDFMHKVGKHGFDLTVNKQLMTDISGLPLGPPRLPLLPHSSICGIKQQFEQAFDKYQNEEE